MIKIFLLSLLLTSTFVASNKVKNAQPIMPLLLIPPPGGAGAPISKDCFNPQVSGFTLRARCLDDNGNYVNASVYFGNCIRNYDGNLSRFNGSTNELYTRYCRGVGYFLQCDCQQPTGGYQKCTIPMDDYFFVNNGRLSC